MSVSLVCHAETIFSLSLFSTIITITNLRTRAYLCFVGTWTCQKMFHDLTKIGHVQKAVTMAAVYFYSSKIL